MVPSTKEETNIMPYYVEIHDTVARKTFPLRNVKSDIAIFTSREAADVAVEHIERLTREYIPMVKHELI